MPQSLQAVVLKCPARARFHFGQIAPDENTSLSDTDLHPRSDTLFSALVNTIEQLDPTYVSSFVDYVHEGRIAFSSAFFCLQTPNHTPIFFLPKPLVFSLWSADSSKFSHKDIRDIQYLSKGVWEQGLEPSDWFGANCKRIDSFVLTNEEADQLPASEQLTSGTLFKVEALPKVTVHSTSKLGGFFYQTSILFTPLPGRNRLHYYFLLQHDLEAEESSRLQNAIHWLADAGIGGERSVGCGYLEEVAFFNFDWQLPVSQFMASLSLIHPTEVEQAHFYKTVLRGGRQTRNHGQLKRVRLLEEGAIVEPTIQSGLPSVAVNTKRPYLRNGKAMLAPLHENISEHEAFR